MPSPLDVLALRYASPEMAGLAGNEFSGFGVPDDLFDPRASNIGAAQLAGTSGAAGNPFAAAGGRPPMFTPDAPGIFGVLGRLSGAPTRDEWMQHRIGTARAAGLAAFQKHVQQAGGNMQRALGSFIQTPEGNQLLTNDPDGLRQLLAAATAQTPETPDPITLSAGEGAFDPRSGRRIASQPTSEAQTFQSFAEISQLPDEEVSALAAAQLIDQTEGDGTQSERAIQRLLSAGAISQDTADRILAGVLQVVPVLDASGSRIGSTIVDMTQRTSQFLPMNEGVPPKPKPGAPNYAPGAPGQEPEPLPQASEAGEVPADIVLGAGIVPMLTELGGSLVGQAIPGLAATETAERRRRLAAIRADARAFRDVLSRRGLVSDVEALEGVLGPLLSPLAEPQNVVHAMLAWHDFLDRHADAATAILNDPSRTGTLRGQADEDLRTIEQARLNLPTREDLQAILPELAARQPVADAFTDAAGAEQQLEQGIREQTGTGAAAPPSDVPTFASPDEASAAYSRGEISVGDIVIIGGQRVRVEPDAPASPQQPRTRGPVSGATRGSLGLGERKRQRAFREAWER